MNTYLYVEGGGNSKYLRIECRRAFRELLDKAGVADTKPRVVACGGRDSAYDDFCTAHETSPDIDPVLLVDSEGPVAALPWDHLAARDRWQRPAGATDTQCFLMVECMEAWIVADAEAVEGHFGFGFRRNRLPAPTAAERTPKTALLDALRRATEPTKKGAYDKGRDSFVLLAQVDAHKLETVSAEARRFFDRFRAGPHH